MTSDWQPTSTLGRTGLIASRLGVGASYGAGAAAYEEAFDHGVNYFYWGSRRRKDMGEAIRNIAKRDRERLIVVVQSYARAGFLVKASVQRALRQLQLDYADVLLLGWYNDVPWNNILDGARGLVDSGKVRHLALSGHRRTLFPEIADREDFGIVHVRYNAVHRGAEREVFPALAEREPTKRPGLVTFTTTRWGHLCDPRKTPAGEPTPTGTDCYRFALSQPSVDLVMSGPATPDHMKQALKALELGPLEPDQMDWMKRVGDGIYRGDGTSGIRDGAVL